MTAQIEHLQEKLRMRLSEVEHSARLGGLDGNSSTAWNNSLRGRNASLPKLMDNKLDGIDRLNKL